MLHTILNLIDCGMTVPEAVTVPRFHQQWLPETTHCETFAISLDGRQILIWLGDADAMASPPLPQQPSIDDEHIWVASAERRHLRASYLRLHENLLEPRHLRFLHIHSFGTPDYASAPFDVALDEAAGRFAILRRVLPTRLPPLWALATGLDGVDAARVAESTFHSPGLHVVAVKFYACSQPEADQPSRAIRTAHIVTPESATSSHYFIQHARNFALDDAAITGFMHQQLRKAFQEDVDGLEAIESLLAGWRQLPRPAARDLLPGRPGVAGDAALPQAHGRRGTAPGRAAHGGLGWVSRALPSLSGGAAPSGKGRRWPLPPATECRARVSKCCPPAPGAFRCRRH